MHPTIVALARSSAVEYGDVARRALRELFVSLGLDQERAGSSEWNPLGDLVPQGARVVVKPNWVIHRNRNESFPQHEPLDAGPSTLAEVGLDCLVTHPDLIEATLDYVGALNPTSVIIGDAPVQGCDFNQLYQACGLERLESREAVEILDFRRTTMAQDRNDQAQDRRPLDRFVLFDLGDESLLTALEGRDPQFRVTMYNPDWLARTHHPGRHQYLVAREVIESDLVINLPKLKSHMKAAVTGTLKNVIGINGNKEFLPHHRKGGSGAGGDCYEGSSFWKARAEDLFDYANRLTSGLRKTALFWSANQMLRVARLSGRDALVEGAWHGNDTVWRTALDLNRILLYGCSDGTLADTPQRRVLHITDAIVGGEGDGPLRPTPAPGGFLTCSTNAAAAEWVNVRAMGWDPHRIPIVREAFGDFRWPLSRDVPESILVADGDHQVPEAQVTPPRGHAFAPSSGWRGYVEPKAVGAALTS